MFNLIKGKRNVSQPVDGNVVGNDLSSLSYESILSRQFSRLFEAMNEGVAIHRVVRDEHKRIVNYLIIDVNPAYEIQTGIQAQDVRGKLATEAYAVDSAPYLTDYAHVVESGKPIRFDSFFEPLKKTFSISVAALGTDMFATVFTDITEFQNRNQLIQNSEKRLRAIFDLSPDGIYIRQLDGKIIDANDAVLNMIGYSRDEVVGKTLSELSVESQADIERVSEIVQQLPENQISEPIEVELRRKDGNTFTAEARVIPMNTDKEKLLFGMMKNLSLVNEKQAIEKRFRQAIEHSDDVVMIADLKGTLTYVNPKFTSFYGYTSEEVVGKKTPAILKAGGMSLAELMGFAKILMSGKTLRQELDNVTKDGKIVRVKSTSSAILSDDDKPVGALIIQQDVSLERQFESKIVQLSQAVNQSPASIVITNTKGEIEYVNAKFTQTTGYNLDEVIGKNPRVLKSGENEPAVYEALWATITQGKEWRGELHNKKKSGELFWEKASISAIKDDSGHITNYLAIKEEITEQKKIELERNQTVERIKYQRDSLIKISKLINEIESNFPQLIQKMMQMTADTLGIERVSYWEFCSHDTQLKLIDLYNQFEKNHHSDELLELAEVPLYVEALKNHRAISSIDVFKDLRVSGFEAYFKKYSVTSMLDASVRVGGVLVGVLSVETGSRRTWVDDEVRFVSEIADQLAQAIINNEKKIAIEQFERRSEELERMNKVMVGRELRMVELKNEIARLKGGDI